MNYYLIGYANHDYFFTDANYRHSCFYQSIPNTGTNLREDKFKFRAIKTAHNIMCITIATKFPLIKCLVVILIAHSLINCIKTYLFCFNIWTNLDLIIGRSRQNCIHCGSDFYTLFCILYN